MFISLQAAIFQPFFRAHAHIDTKRREPYLMPEETMVIIRAAIKKRYTFLPYLYSLFHESEKFGIPPMRALWMEFPKETKTFDIDDEFLLGKCKKNITLSLCFFFFFLLGVKNNRISYFIGPSS